MKSSTFYHLQNNSTGEIIDERKTANLSQLSLQPISVKYYYEYFLSRRAQNNNSKLSYYQKYQGLLPLTDELEPISLHEGNSPLLKSTRIGKELGLDFLYFKNEGANPTGAFKDRGSFVEMNKAKELNAQGVVLASTGNMAASVAAYAAKVGIPCYVCVPKVTPQAKLAQVLYYGGRVLKVEGGYDDAVGCASFIAQKKNYYLAGDYFYRLEGQKTLAYELIDQMQVKVPSYIIVPIGNGTNIAAIGKGFREFFDLKLIDALPKFIGVEIEGYDAVSQAYNKGEKTIQQGVSDGKTVASAIAVKYPTDGEKALDIIYTTEGQVVVVNEESTLVSQRELSQKESIFVEPSSATVLAALKQLCEKGVFHATDSVVSILTGTGLKDPTCNLDQFSSFIYDVKDKEAILETIS